MEIKAVRGVKDILPGEVEKWQFVERVAREVFERYGYAEIKIPIFEHTSLFARLIGETTDIVEKEMYSFVAISTSSVRSASAASSAIPYESSTVRKRRAVASCVRRRRRQTLSASLAASTLRRCSISSRGLR